MLKSLGQVADLEVLECAGIDAVRGIIGREKMLESSIFLFRDCPMIHSFGVRRPFYAIFISRAGKLLGKEYVGPNRLSGFYQVSTLCLESIAELPEQITQEVFVLACGSWPTRILFIL